ncbi:MAG: lytic polysaccharide monooxygenase [Planctomycetes bacterium]|nr:lytic polysaccharide monooxygenase [Planctomycetota bacterium]
MAKLTEEQYGMFIDYVHKKLEFNTDCRFCNRSKIDKDNKELRLRDLFFFKFKRMSDGLYDPNSTLFTCNFSAPHFEDYFIIRICKNCGHREYFDFEVLLGKTYKEMLKEVKSW